jgi:hypothetical protein
MTCRAWLIMICIVTGLGLGAQPSSGAEVTLDGYTFEDDSYDLFLNPYYDRYNNRTSMGQSLNGYGEFANHTANMWYSFPDIIAGINCAAMFVESYYPTFVEGTSSFQLDYYEGYVWYARDVDDNIHILQMALYLLEGLMTEWSWDYRNLDGVNTTLLYPSSPVAGQEVFGGHVEAVGVDAGRMGECMEIVFDALPQFPSRTVTQYLAPHMGLIGEAYDWEGGTNGFSYNGEPPVTAHKSGGSWEKFTDRYCFISACAL